MASGWTAREITLLGISGGIAGVLLSIIVLSFDNHNDRLRDLEVIAHEVRTGDYRERLESLEHWRLMHNLEHPDRRSH